jgi:hypothetical protein
MKYYFELQCRRVLRMIRDLGVNPYVGLMSGIVLFVIMSVLIFKKVSFPQYIYPSLALLYLIPLGNNSRNEFLKITFLEKHYFMIRMLENLISILPFCIFLFIQKQYLISILTGSVAILLSIFNKVTRPDFVIPSPFSQKPYEFTTGFRRSYILISAIFILTAIAIYYKNFNLGIFALLILFLVCCSFYSVHDPIFYVWIHAQSPEKFLRNKIKSGLIYCSCLSVIIALTLFIAWPGMGIWILAVSLIGFLYLIVVILSVFANYPAPSTVSHKFQLAFSMLCPPLLLFVIPNLYYQALRRLNVYLK